LGGADHRKDNYSSLVPEYSWQWTMNRCSHNVIVGSVENVDVSFGR
jgi:hypothetical protein